MYNKILIVKQFFKPQIWTMCLFRHFHFNIDQNLIYVFSEISKMILWSYDWKAISEKKWIYSVSRWNKNLQNWLKIDDVMYGAVSDRNNNTSDGPGVNMVFVGHFHVWMKR